MILTILTIPLFLLSASLLVAIMQIERKEQFYDVLKYSIKRVIIPLTLFSWFWIGFAYFFYGTTL